MFTDKLGHAVPRPPTLWRAWEETTRYVIHHSRQPATLALAWNSQGIDAPWMAQFNWMQNMERVSRLDSAGMARSELWQIIESGYTFFQNAEDARRAPRAYPENYVFGEMEQTLIHRLISLGIGHCQPAATLIFNFRAELNAEPEVDARLICHARAQTISGAGPDLLRACQDLYPRVVQKLGTGPRFG
jgi:hypothetical protein